MSQKEFLMAKEIIGRELEISLLEEAYNSGKPELVAVYGRRRIGKTYLVKTLFQDRIDFFVTGQYEGKLADELFLWNRKLVESSGVFYPMPKDWNDAFGQFRNYLETIDKKRILVFIDEMPWLDTPKSKFVRAFESFWNDWASSRDNLMIVVCGSATTWMNDNVIAQKGGLHNRVTRKVKLSQFSLHEMSLFLERKGIKWTRHQIAECFMILGGTPYYLDLLQKSCSLPQNIDFLFFRRNAELDGEYNVLLKSLFKDSQIYRRVIETLAKRSKGMTRKEICNDVKFSDGGAFTVVLENLMNCDFIRSYSAFGKKDRDTMYQLSDMFILFYLKFVRKGDGKDESFWSNSIDDPSRRAWSGYAFEQLCFSHIKQIKERLGIRGVLSNVCSWSRPGNKAKGVKGRQIDMLIERRDQIINVCEAKFSIRPYTVTEKYLAEMNERMEDFRETTGTKSALHLTLIASSGLTQNECSGEIQSVVTLDDLFKSL